MPRPAVIPTRAGASEKGNRHLVQPWQGPRPCIFREKDRKCRGSQMRKSALVPFIQAGLKLTLNLRMTSDSLSSCLHLRTIVRTVSQQGGGR